MKGLTSAFILALVVVAVAQAPSLCGLAAAQELEPRTYSPSPVGANFLLLSGARSTGDIVVDPSIPVEDVDADINTVSLGYSRTFGLLGRSASAAAILPYVWGTASGVVLEQSKSVDRSGIADAKLRLAMNLLGAPALTRAEFAKRRPERALGASLVVSVPTGQYDPDKLINIGTNRWAFKPEIGFTQPAKRWDLEAYAAVWLYTDNDDYLDVHTREQAPLGAFQGHVAYTFKPRLWLAGDATFYTGGRTTVDGVENADLQGNSRFGVTASAPIGRQGSVKLAWATGATTRFGGSFDSFILSWQYLWFD